MQVLVFGCAYERIADESCSATTLRRRRDEWIASGVMEQLQRIVLDAYDRMIGPDLSDGRDCCTQSRHLWRRQRGKSPVDQQVEGQRSMVVDANGIPIGATKLLLPTTTTRRYWKGPWTLWRSSESYQSGASTSTAVTIRR